MPDDSWTQREITEAFEERAAIIEYCGGLSRAEAERLAQEERDGMEQDAAE